MRRRVVASPPDMSSCSRSEDLRDYWVQGLGIRYMLLPLIDLILTYRSLYRIFFFHRAWAGACSLAPSFACFGLGSLAGDCPLFGSKQGMGLKSYGFWVDGSRVRGCKVGSGA